MAAAAAAFVNVSAVAGQKRPRDADESPGRSVRAASGGYQPHPLGSDEDEGSEDEDEDEDDEEEDKEEDSSTEEASALVLASSRASASSSSSGSDSGGDEDASAEDSHHGSVCRHQCLPEKPQHLLGGGYCLLTHALATRLQFASLMSAVEATSSRKAKPKSKKSKPKTSGSRSNSGSKSSSSSSRYDPASRTRAAFRVAGT